MNIFKCTWLFWTFVSQLVNHFAFPCSLALEESNLILRKHWKLNIHNSGNCPYKQEMSSRWQCYQIQNIAKCIKKSPKHFVGINIPPLRIPPHIVLRIDWKISVFTNDFVCFKQTYKSRAEARYFNMCINGAVISMCILKVRNYATDHKKIKSYL